MSKVTWLYPNTAERNYMRLLLPYVRQMSKTTQARLKELDLLKVDAIGDWSDALTALFLDLLAAFLDDGQTVTARLPDIFAQISKFNDQQWRVQVKAGTGIEIGPSGAVPFNARAMGSVSNPNSVRATFGMGVDVYRAEPWLVPLQTNWIAQNTTLIKSIPQQYLSQVQEAVRRGVMQGSAPSVIAESLMKIEGVTERRAKIIARDQSSKANAALSEQRMTDLGIDSYFWETSHDERVRPAHAKSQGDELQFKTGNPKDQNLNPGQPILCLPGNSNIEIAHAVKKLWRRRCTDNLSFLVTASGKRIEATPNHPVLTNRGWIGIQDVRMGDYLVNTSDQSFHGVMHDIQTSPTNISEIFDAISSYVSINTSFVSELQFHGDHANGEIDTIDIDSFLRSEDYSSIRKGFAELFFSNANMAFRSELFGIDGSLEKAIAILWPSSIESMRGCGKLLTLLNSEFGHSDNVCLTAIANFNSMLNQSLADSPSINIELLRQLKLTDTIDIFRNNNINGQILAIMRLASIDWNDKTVSAEVLGEVVGINAQLISGDNQIASAVEKFDCVVEKGLREFRGSHVYNLETESNWYSSNNLIIHNCRCWARPKFN